MVAGDVQSVVAREVDGTDVGTERDGLCCYGHICTAAGCMQKSLPRGCFHVDPDGGGGCEVAHNIC